MEADDSKYFNSTFEVSQVPHWSLLRRKNFSAKFAFIYSFLYTFFNPLAKAETPPRNYLDLGPHFIIAPGIGSTTEFRDLLLQKSSSANFVGTATYRGWSMSGMLHQSIDSSTTKASELLATYSHKLPLVDVHLGAAHGKTNGDYSGECSAASISASSNSLPTTKLDLTVQDDLSGECRLVSIGASQVLLQQDLYQVDLRASVNNWKVDDLDSNGWSLRLMGHLQFDSRRSIHYHIGFVDSRLKQGSLQNNPSGVTMGINYVWELR